MYIYKYQLKEKNHLVIQQQQLMLLELTGKTRFQLRGNFQFAFKKSVFGAEIDPYGHKNYEKYFVLKDKSRLVSNELDI